MRILHVTDHVPPTLGGIETHVWALAARQARDGHRVTVLTYERGPAPAPTPYFEVVRARSRLELPVAASEFDVVHAHLSVVAPFTAPVSARFARAGVPTLATVHSFWDGLGPLPAWAASLSGLASAPVTWSAVSGVAARCVATRLGVPQVHVLRNAVDVAPRAATPTAGKGFEVVTVMRVARRKRPLALVPILEHVLAGGRRDVRLTVVGAGPLLDRLTRTLEHRGLRDRVLLTGRAAPADVLAHVARADAYLAPARLESFGLAALEARTLGLPVVGHAGSGLGEFVTHGREGLLADDDAGLARQLARLADDTGLRMAIAEHNRLVPSGLDWAAALQAHESLYAQARGLVRR